MRYIKPYGHAILSVISSLVGTKHGLLEFLLKFILSGISNNLNQLFYKQRGRERERD